VQRVFPVQDAAMVGMGSSLSDERPGSYSATSSQTAGTHLRSHKRCHDMFQGQRRGADLPQFPPICLVV
jgi:hypothetical protein